MDPREAIAERPLTAFQLTVIGVLFCLNAVDGFDVLAISFAAPGITCDWGLSPPALGFVISLGLFGTGVGSLLIAPFADKVGRRPVIFASWAAMAIGMLICALAKCPGTLSAGRLMTGAGVGALVPCISALCAWLLRHFNWNAIFIAGSVFSGAMMLAPWLFVPESMEYLILRPSSKSLQKVNAILRRLHQPPVSKLPAAGAELARRAGVDFFVRPSLLVLAFIITLIYGLHNAALSARSESPCSLPGSTPLH